MKNHSVVILILTLSLLCVLVFAQLPPGLDLPPPPPTPDMGGSDDNNDNSSNPVIPDQNDTEDNQDDESETNEGTDILNLNQGSPELEEEEPQSSFSFNPLENFSFDLGGDYTIYLMSTLC